MIWIRNCDGIHLVELAKACLATLPHVRQLTPCTRVGKLRRRKLESRRWGCCVFRAPFADISHTTGYATTSANAIGGGNVAWKKRMFCRVDVRQVSQPHLSLLHPVTCPRLQPNRTCSSFGRCAFFFSHIFFASACMFKYLSRKPTPTHALLSFPEQEYQGESALFLAERTIFWLEQPSFSVSTLLCLSCTAAETP